MFCEILNFTMHHPHTSVQVLLGLIEPELVGLEAHCPFLRSCTKECKHWMNSILLFFCDFVFYDVSFILCELLNSICEF